MDIKKQLKVHLTRPLKGLNNNIQRDKLYLLNNWLSIRYAGVLFFSMNQIVFSQLAKKSKHKRIMNRLKYDSHESKKQDVNEYLWRAAKNV